MYMSMVWQLTLDLSVFVAVGGLQRNIVSNVGSFIICTYVYNIVYIVCIVYMCILECVYICLCRLYIYIYIWICYLYLVLLLGQAWWTITSKCLCDHWSCPYWALLPKKKKILQAHSHWPVSPARGTYSGCYNPCSVVLSWGYVSPARGTDSGCYNPCSIILRCGIDLGVQTKVGLQLPRPRYFGRGSAHAPCEVWLRSCVFLPRTK